MSLDPDPRMQALATRLNARRISRRTALKGALAGGLALPALGVQPLGHSAAAQAAGTMTIALGVEPITMDPVFADGEQALSVRREQQPAHGLFVGER